MIKGKLFRNEVMQARRGQWLGDIHLATPLAFRWLALLAGALALTIVLFMVFGHYTRREQVSGQLVPSAGLLGMHSPVTGTVVHVYVHEGETVHQGQPLMEISGEHDSAALGPTHALIGTQLRSQAKRLHMQLVNQKKSAHKKSIALHNNIALLKQQIAQINHQITLTRKQVQSTSEMLVKMWSLRRKGYISAIRLQKEGAKKLQLKSHVKALVRQRLDTRQHIAQVRQQLTQLPLGLANKQIAVKQSLSQNSQQLAQNALQRDAVLRAPADGVVATLLVKTGQAVSAKQALLSVLPKGSVLQAQLLVPSSAIGFVKPGNPVVMRYQAFPYQKFGQQYGKVVNVSTSALSNEEVASLLGERVKQPVYRVLVALNRQTIDAYGKVDALKPGMALDASIMLDRRSLWQWAFEPLYGLRESLATSQPQQQP